MSLIQAQVRKALAWERGRGSLSCTFRKITCMHSGTEAYIVIDEFGFKRSPVCIQVQRLT